MCADIISQRLQFMKLDPEAQRNLQATKSIVMRELPGALDGFYLQVRAFSETAKFFSGEAQIAGAKTRQVAHWDMISSGRFDASYVQAVTTIGEIHAKIGLEPRWYIGGYALVLETLVAKVIDEKWPKKRGFGAPKGPSSQEVAAQLGALVKATMLDMDLAISVYLREAEAARRKSEEATLSQERKAVSTSIGSAISSLSEGDLTHRLSDDIPAEYMQLRADFNESMERLQQTMLAINANAHMIQAGTDQIKANTDDLSRRAGRQAASLEETAATLDEITATVKGTADGANHAREVVTVATNEAEKGGNVVREATAAMARIEESSHKIGQIIGVIDEIAFQTNLLALNAGVEAARAGEAGRGFAVVASEVRGLAQRSAEAAKEIKALISTSTSEVDQGVHLVEETGRALRLIAEQIAEVNRVVGNIATSAQEQASGLHQVNIAVNEMDKLTQQNAAMVEESTAAAHTLSTETEELGRLIGHFRVGEKADASPQRSTKTAPSTKPQAARPALKTFGGGGAARKPAREAAANEWEEF